MEIQRLFNAILRKMWLIVLLAVVGGVFMGAYSKITSVKMFKSEASVYIMSKSKSSNNGEGLSYQDLLASKQFAQNYGEIINSRRVLIPVLNELKVNGLTESELENCISIEQKTDSNVMSISAMYSDPKVAAAIANSVSKVFASEIKELTGTESVGILDEAQVNNTPIPSDSKKKTLIGIIAGIAIAIGIIYIFELFDSTIRSVNEVEYVMGLKVIGIIPDHNIR